MTEDGYKKLDKQIKGKCFTFYLGSLKKAYIQLRVENNLLKDACEMWMKVESERVENNPCPDLALRAEYRKRAILLTKKALNL